MPKLLRPILIGFALTASAIPALAQAPRQPARAPAAPLAQPPAPPPISPCRTAEEICYLGVVIGSQILVLYTNAPNATGLEKPLDVTAGDNAKVDLAPNAGRVVMLTGTLDPKSGLTKAEVIEVASPLVSLALKAQLAGGPPAEEAGAPGPKGAPPRRR